MKRNTLGIALSFVILIGLISPAFAFTETTVKDIQTDWNTYVNTTVNFEGTFLFAISGSYGYVENNGYVTLVGSILNPSYNFSSFNRGDRLNITGYAWIDCNDYSANWRIVKLGNDSVVCPNYAGTIDDNIDLLSTGYAITEPEVVTNMSDYDTNEYGKYITSTNILFKEITATYGSGWDSTFIDIQSSNAEFGTYTEPELIPDFEDLTELKSFGVMVGFIENFYIPYIFIEGLETNTLENGICETLESYDPSAWNYEPQCEINRYGGTVTGFALASAGRGLMAFILGIFILAVTVTLFSVDNFDARIKMFLLILFLIVFSIVAYSFLATW